MGALRSSLCLADEGKEEEDVDDDYDLGIFHYITSDLIITDVFRLLFEMNREEGRTGASIEEFLCKRPESSSSSSSFFQHHSGNRSQLRISPPCVPSYFLLLVELIK